MRSLRPLARLALAALATVAAGAPRAARAQDPGEEERFEGGDVLRQRFEYFFGQRQYPFATIPIRLTRAQQLRLRSGGRVGARLDVVPGGTGSWFSLGPRPIVGSNTGRVTALAVDPRDARVAYVGGAQGGVWKTVDAGATWTPLTDQQCSLATGSIALDPVNPDIVYVGTGEANFSGDSYYGCGVLRSTDGGTTWTQLGGAIFDTQFGGATIGALWVDPRSAGSATATTVLAATSFGLYRSTDAGTSWSHVLPTSGSYPVTDVVADPGDPRTVYAALTSIGGNAANGVYKSTDGGATWTRVPTTGATGFAASGVGRIALATSPAAPRAVWALVENPAQHELLGLYKSTDAGVTWAQTMTSPSSVACNRQCWYDLTLAVDPGDASVVYVGTVSLFKSVDGGVTFGQIARGVHVDQHVTAVGRAARNTIWAGNDGGIFRSTDGGTSWASLNGTLALTQFYAGVSLGADNTLRLLGGTQDNGTVEYGGAFDWPAVLGGDGGYTASDPRAAGVGYAETQWAASSGYSGPRRRGPGSSGFELATTGIDLSEAALFIAPMVLDGARPSRLWFGTRHVYLTRDDAGTWAPLFQLPSGAVSAIGPAETDSQTVYVGSSAGGVWATHDLGATWTGTGAGLPQRFVTDVAVHRALPNVAWATVSGFGTGHVFKTTDGGTTWRDVSGDLPNVPANAVVLLPDGALDVGTDLGVYHSTNDGASWSPFVGGLPNVAVVDLLYHRPTSTLVAATHGRGMWGATLPVVAPPTMLATDHPTIATTAGAPLPAIAVGIRSAGGDLVPDARGDVSVSLTSGAGTLRGTSRVATSQGVATFGDLALDGVGTFTLTFTASGLAPATTTITVLPAGGLTLSPRSRRATLVAGDATTRADSLDVLIVGNGASTQPWTAAHRAPWSTLAAAAGTGNGRLRWSRSAGALGAGRYVDTLTVTAPGASGSPTSALDTLLILARQPATVASFAPDTLRGLPGSAAAADVVVDMTGAEGLRLSAYVATVAWDSTVVRLDSVSTRALGAPNVTVLSAGAVRMAAGSTTGANGVVPLARLHLRIVGANGSSAPVSVTMTRLVAAGSDAFDLLPDLTIRGGVVRAEGTLRGDVDGDGAVTAADAHLILAAVAGLALPAGARAYPNGDANCDGIVSALDAQIVLTYVAKQPVAGACVGTVK